MLALPTEQAGADSRAHGMHRVRDFTVKRPKHFTFSVGVKFTAKCIFLHLGLRPNSCNVGPISRTTNVHKLQDTAVYSMLTHYNSSCIC